MKMVINFDSDGFAMNRLRPILESISLETRYIIESLLSDDEALYKEKWGSTLVHSDRDRLVEYLAQYLELPIRKMLKTTYVYSGTPESHSTMIEIARGTLDSSEVAIACTVDWEGLDYDCVMISDDGTSEVKTCNAGELLVDSAIDILQIKLSTLYKRICDAIIKEMSAIVNRAPTRLHVKHPYQSDVKAGTRECTGEESWSIVWH